MINALNIYSNNILYSQIYNRSSSLKKKELPKNNKTSKYVTYDINCKKLVNNDVGNYYDIKI